jgi:hypothetical protein
MLHVLGISAPFTLFSPAYCHFRSNVLPLIVENNFASIQNHRQSYRIEYFNFCLIMQEDICVERSVTSWQILRKEAWGCWVDWKAVVNISKTNGLIEKEFVGQMCDCRLSRWLLCGMTWLLSPHVEAKFFAGAIPVDAFRLLGRGMCYRYVRLDVFLLLETCVNLDIY